MRADYKVFMDACVLANFGVCNLLLRLSEKPRLILPHWSPEVLSEVRRVHEKLGWPEHLMESFPRNQCSLIGGGLSWRLLKSRIWDLIVEILNLPSLSGRRAGGPRCG